MKKTVKAWAVVTKRGGIVRAYKREIEARAWKFAGPPSDRVLPCTIVFDLPKKRAKK